MKTKLFVAMVVLGAASFGAGCDDTENTGGAGGATSSSTSTKASTTGSMTTTTTTGSMTGSTSTGEAPLCPVTGTTDTCENACAALYDCAAVSMCNGKDLCAGVDGTPAQKAQFIGSAMGTCSTTVATMCGKDTDCPMGETCSGGCLIACANTPTLKAIVDPMDCEGTVSSLSTIKPDSFGAFCTGMMP